MIPKFRAWEKNMNAMIPVENIDFLAKQINTNSAWRMFHEIELMQSTGIKDKNGVEIYGGDEISYEIDEGYGKETVITEVGLRPPFNVDIHYRDYDETSIYYLADEDTWDWEVIGNIYENEN